MEPTSIDGLAPHIADLLRQAGALRHYPARSFIFYEGDPGNGVFLIESGLVRIDRTTSTGKVVLLDLAGEGALIGELSVIDRAARSATLSTVSESSVRYITTDRFLALMRDHPELQEAVLVRLARRLRGLSNQFLETSTMNASARVAARLIRLIAIEQSKGRAKKDDAGIIDLTLPINQEEVGQWAGLSREGTAKGLKTLRSIGVIKTARKQVWVLDPDRLTDHADL